MANETILVVDDEELLRNAIVFQFKREGFNVLSASNGKEAFEIIKTTKVDAVVSDIQMPGGNGIDLLKDVKNYDANIPVLVFITAFADITEDEAYDLGANAIFSKPFDRKVLVGCIKEAVQSNGRIWKKQDLTLPSESKSITSESVCPIGRGGAFIPTTDANVASGEIVKVELNAQAGDNVIQINAAAKVRWTHKKGVGVEFLSVEENSIPEYETWLDGATVKAYIPNK